MKFDYLLLIYLHTYLHCRSENNQENYAVFTHTIKPMLNHVKMHPSLVTQTRDYEKTASRWKRMELHDIIVESSRYSLDNIIRLGLNFANICMLYLFFFFQ